MRNLVTILYVVWFSMVLTDFGTMGIRACLFVLITVFIVMNLIITIKRGKV